MNKQTELEILRECVAKLGERSYCGPWLAQQIDGIAKDIGNDHFPQVDRNAAIVECNQIKRNAEAWAAEMQATNERVCKAKLDAAHGEACSIRGRILREIRQIQSALGVST